MYAAPLDALPLWGFFLAEMAIGWASLEGGYRLGRWRHVHLADEKESPVGAMVAAILALVALMLAFTFSVAAQRFDAKRLTIVNEANAIGTTYLRARLLPQHEQTEVTKLLRQYIDIRIRGLQNSDVGGAIAKSELLQERMWQLATTAAAKERTSIMTGLFVQALNDLIDVHAKRLLTGVRSRIPLIVWVVLFAISALGIGATGYQAGLSGTRRTPAMFALIVAFVVVLFLIVDLDRGNEGFLIVDQTALIDLQKSMQSPESK